ncbi:MAG: GntR family transcriptional regulator [Reyranellaceae bacterium]
MSSASTVPFGHSVPLYHQIALVLRGRAEAGGLGPNGSQATEQQLCTEFGVSRSTVRQALGLLKQDGLLRSRRGVGTRPVPHTPPRRLTSAVGDPLHAGLGTAERVVSIEAAEPPPEVRDFLQPDASGLIRLVRTHTLDGAPLSIVVTWLPARYAGGVTAGSLQRASLHEILWRRHGLFQKRSVHRIGVARADMLVASLLGVGMSDPVLHVQSSARLDDGRPIRWTDNYFREDRFAYQTEIDWKKPERDRGTTRGRGRQ